MQEHGEEFGSWLRSFCPNCGRELRAGERICDGCGADVRGVCLPAAWHLRRRTVRSAREDGPSSTA